MMSGEGYPEPVAAAAAQIDVAACSGVTARLPEPACAGERRAGLVDAGDVHRLGQGCGHAARTPPGSPRCPPRQVETQHLRDAAQAELDAL